MIVATTFLFIIFQTFCNVDSFLIVKLKSHDWMIVATIFLFIIFQIFCNVDSFPILKLKSHDWLILLCIRLTVIAGSILGIGREHRWRQANLRNLAGASVTGCVNLGQSLCVSGDS